jgi:hypothetical protein
MVICSTKAIESQRGLPPRGAGPWALPQRAVRTQVPISGDPFPGADRGRSDSMGRALNACPQRLRHHLRRPDAGGRELLTCHTSTHTVNAKLPLTDQRPEFPT